MFLGVLAHALATPLWDWWYFSFYQVKESELVPKVYFEIIQATPEEMDVYSLIVVKVRRMIFPISCVITGTFYWIQEVENLDPDETFMLAYFGGIVLITLAVLLMEKVKIPFLHQWQNSNQLPYSMNVIHSPMYNAPSTNKISNPFA